MSGNMTLENANFELTLRPGHRARNMTFYPLVTQDGSDLHLLLGPHRDLPCDHPVRTVSLRRTWR